MRNIEKITKRTNLTDEQYENRQRAKRKGEWKKEARTGKTLRKDIQSGYTSI